MRPANLYQTCTILMPGEVRGSAEALVKPLDSVLAGMQEHRSECSQSACLGCTPLGKKYTKMGLCTNAAIGRRMQSSKDFAQFS